MHPVISALKHHKTAVVLMTFEIALTCAIITNALSVIAHYLTSMSAVTGIADNELIWATTRMFDLGKNANVQNSSDLAVADLAALREISGVQSVAIVNSLPFHGVIARQTIFRHRGDKKSSLKVDLYLGTSGVVRTLGVQLLQGRYFLPQEFVNWGPSSPAPAAAIITRKLAEKLWPGQDPLGKAIYFDTSGSQVTHVVGVIKHLLNPGVSPGQGAQSNLILPVKAVDIANQKYVLRVTPANRSAVRADIPEVLHHINPARVVETHMYSSTISDHFHGDRAMVLLLVAVIAFLLAITALGLAGLSSFWVQQRTRTIGIRRALGATRSEIQHYFQIENCFIVTTGAVLGVILAIALNLLLLQHYEMPRLSLWYLPVGAVVLLVLGQLAVLAPALRASHVPPNVATKAT